jgi:uncharacterized membrane protein
MIKFLAQLLRPATNATSVTFHLINLLNVKLTESSIKKDLEQHPDFPSLLSISDTLNKFGINNLSLKISATDLSVVPTPFITQLNAPNSGIDYFTVVTQIKKDTVHYLDPESQKMVPAATELFTKRWKNIVLVPEANENAGEANYNLNVKLEKQKRTVFTVMVIWLPTMVMLAGIAGLFESGIAAILPLFFAILSLTGCGAAFLLLWYEFDKYNPLLSKFCGGGEEKINCNAILSSKASKVAGVSWSAIGFSYFCGSLLLQILSGILNPQTLFILSWISVFATPYIFYSIIYQWRIAKHWCTLCLFVQGLLLLQVATGFIGRWHTLFAISEVSPGVLIQLIVAFAFPLMLIQILFETLRNGKEKENSHTELQRLKHNQTIFISLLEKQQKLTYLPTGLGIQIGDKDAAFKIVKVCNPYCGPCAKAHLPIEEILQNDQVQLQIIFTATNHIADYRSDPVRHLLAIHEKYDEKITKKALHDWYYPENKDYGKFAVLYKMNGELKQQGDKLDAMAEWCKQNEIVATPTFFISVPQHEQEGSQYYKLPDIYNVEDLKYLLSV